MGIKWPTGTREKRGKIQIVFKEKGRDGRTYKTLDSKLYPYSAAGVKAAGELRAKIIYEIKYDLYDPCQYWEDEKPLHIEGSFYDWAQAWLKNPANDWSEATYYKYRKILQNHWIPHFHAWDIGLIQHTDIISALTENKANKLSPAYYNDVISTIRGVVQHWIESKGHLDEKNFTRQLKNKKRVQGEPDPFDYDEARAIIDFATKKNITYGAYFHLAFFSGIRGPGELLGLKKQDFDFKRREVRVERIRRNNGEIQPYTKTRVRRKVYMNTEIEAAAKTLFEDSADMGPMLFYSTSTTKNTRYGKELRSSKALLKVWHDAVEKLELRPRDMYNTRHTFATFGLMNEANPAWMAKQMGHSIEEFFKTYATWIEGQMNTLQTQNMERAIANLKSKVRPDCAQIVALNV